MRKEFVKVSRRSPRKRGTQILAREPRVAVRMSCMTTSAESATEISRGVTYQTLAPEVAENSGPPSHG
jgi:hypothetical protein